jgi:hypothetical protein
MHVAENMSGGLNTGWSQANFIFGYVVLQRGETLSEAEGVSNTEQTSESADYGDISVHCDDVNDVATREKSAEYWLEREGVMQIAIALPSAVILYSAAS